MTTTIDGSAGVTTNTGAVYDGLQRSTAVASTSGSNIDFTGIPSWAKRITVMFSGVSTNGLSFKLVQIGAGTIANTGYVSTGLATGSTNLVTSTSSTAGFIMYSNTGTDVISGHMIITNISGNIWISSHCGKVFTSYSIHGGGDVTLSGTLDRVRVTTVNGTDTFDAGTINVMYE